MQDAKIWVDILDNRIKKFNPASEDLSLATAWNQIGICYLNKDEVDHAIDSWIKSVDLYKNAKNRPDFSGTFPSVSLALMYALQGQAEKGEVVLMPVLEEHERILGKDDTTTTE